MDEHVIRTYVRQPEVFVSGEGARLRTDDGREFLDFLGGIAVSALGHGHPKLTEALRDQAGKVLHTSNLFRHPYTERVAALLAEQTGMDSVFFANSGAEANECAMKLVRKAQRLRGHEDRTGYVAIEGAFHGRTMGALSITAGAKYREPFAPLIPGVQFIDRGDLGALAIALRGEGDAPPPAALFLEPIQGEGGIYDHGSEFRKAARRLCDETGTLLVCDEVQCGTGRTGRFLMSQHDDLRPDVVTLAKPLAAGLPIGVCVVTEALADTLVPGDHGSTFAGGPLVTRAAMVVLEELRDGLLGKVETRGRQLRDGLENLQKDFSRVLEVRGRGLMLGIRLESGGAELQKALYRAGLITNCTAGEVIRLLPPYVVTAADIDRALETLAGCLAAL